jgi:hypothetical protein
MLFLPALFGIFVLMAFLGWGELVALACGQKKPVPAGTLTFLGASCIIFLGGLLNLLHALGLGASVGLLAIGFLAFFRWPKRIPEAAAKLAREARATPLAALALLAAWVAIIVLYLSFCRGWRFGVDDLQGYLTWPEKALQTGWLGDDPFSLRRFSGLGSNSFLQSLVLSFFPLPNTTVIEPAVAFLMIALFAQEKSVGPRRLAWAALSLAIMATCFVFAPRVNTSSLILPIGFVMVLIVYCCETAVEPLTWAAAAWLALFATPLTSLKGNVAPFAPLALTAFFILRGLAGRNILREGIRAIVFYFALLLPWLLSSHGSTGSWYYPLVGKSYLVTSYHDVDGLMRVEKGPMDFYYAFVNCTIYPVFLAAIILPLGAILAVAGRRAQKCWIAWLTLGYALLLFVLEKHRVLFLTWEILGLVSVAITAWRYRARLTAREGAWVALLAGAWLCNFGLYVMLSGGLYQRYFFTLAYGCFFACIPLLIAFSVRYPSLSPAYAFTTALFAFGFSTYDVNFDSTLSNGLLHPGRFWVLFQEQLENVLHGHVSLLAYAPPEPGHPWLYGQMQDLVPPGRLILARTKLNYAFDFARNPILIADQAGEISLPPGMPYRRGADALAVYFQNLGICYIAYASGPGGLRDGEGNNLHDYYAWVRAEASLAKDFYTSFEGLSKKFPILYSDTENSLLKLCD